MVFFVLQQLLCILLSPSWLFCYYGLYGGGNEKWGRGKVRLQRGGFLDFVVSANRLALKRFDDAKFGGLSKGLILLFCFSIYREGRIKNERGCFHSLFSSGGCQICLLGFFTFLLPLLHGFFYKRWEKEIQRVIGEIMRERQERE